VWLRQQRAALAGVWSPGGALALAGGRPACGPGNYFGILESSSLLIGVAQVVYCCRAATGRQQRAATGRQGRQQRRTGYDD